MATKRHIYDLSIRDTLMVLAGVVIALLLAALFMYMQHSQTALPYTKSGVTAPWLPKSVTQWDKTINQMAERYKIDPNFIAVIITLESGGDAKAQSEAGAVGLMQVTPLTAKDIAAKYLKKPVSKYDLQNPTTSIEFGTAYMAWLRDQFGTEDTVRTAEYISAGYNGGPSAAQALIDGEGLRDSQTVVYSRDAFNMYRERVSKNSPTYDRWKERGGQSLVDAASK